MSTRQGLVARAARWSWSCVAMSAVGLALQSSAALALSGGCTSLNYTTSFNPAVSGTYITDFEANEIVTVTVTTTGAADFQFSIGGSGANFSFPSAGSASQSITIFSTGFLGVNQSTGVLNSGPITVTFACGAAPPNTDSRRLDEMRKRLSKIAAYTSSTNVGESVTDAITNAFGREDVREVEDQTFPAPSGLGFSTKPRGRNAAKSPWHAWVDLRHTGTDNDTVSAFEGRHVNLTGGLSYRFHSSFIAGVVIGYENFDYELRLDDARLDGNGAAAGGYFGWMFWDRLRLDGMLTYGRISYDAQAGTAAADFDANRVVGMLRLSGRWNSPTWYFEPSSRVIYAHEKQDAFTDSLGVSQPSYSFDVGVASLGGEVGLPLHRHHWTLTPTIGLFADYRFGDDTAATVAALPDLDDGWSGRIVGRLRLTSETGLSLHIGADYGGLGADTQAWRATAGAALRF